MIESRYTVLYRDKPCLGVARGPRHGRACATIRPAEIRPTREQGREARVRKRPGPRVGRDTKICIVVEEGDLWVVIQRNKATKRRSSSLRHGVGALQHAQQRARHNTQCARGRGLCYDTILYRDRGELRHSKTCLRHGWERPTIRPNARHDTAPCARPRRCACVVGARLGFKVCTLCTQPSLNSGHCFESLFMSTIHEHCL